VFTCETKRWNKTKVGVAYPSIKKKLRSYWQALDVDRAEQAWWLHSNKFFSVFSQFLKLLIASASYYVINHVFCCLRVLFFSRDLPEPSSRDTRPWSRALNVPNYNRFGVIPCSSPLFSLPHHECRSFNESYTTCKIYEINKIKYIYMKILWISLFGKFAL